MLAVQVQRDQLQGLLAQATRCHPDCTLQVATYGLQGYLNKKQRLCPVCGLGCSGWSECCSRVWMGVVPPALHVWMCRSVLVGRAMLCGVCLALRPCCAEGGTEADVLWA